MAANPGNEHHEVRQQKLHVRDPSQPTSFIIPVKKINEGHHVNAFLTSQAYRDIGLFVLQLNIAMCPRRRKVDGKDQVKDWPLDTADIQITGPVKQLQGLLDIIAGIIDDVPPDAGPRRFGNISFRRWYEVLESQLPQLLEQNLPQNILALSKSSAGEATALDELSAYLLGAFGSAQRLDYGTGHELSFLAFLGGIWKLGGFGDGKETNGAVERSIVLGLIEPYLRVVRRLILTYTLEPAGSHGVWGLDDHSFLPYIFGSAQYAPPIVDGETMPEEGSLPNSPDPPDVVKKNVVTRERKHNMYFSAIGFINDVKTGPFWEHSPILFDISGVRAGWAKINKGMMKMYAAEVLSKFPVVQHFPFGSLFSWEQDPHAIAPPSSAHTASQPSSQPSTHNVSVTRDGGSAPISRREEGTKAPWANQAHENAPTAAPWARPTSSVPVEPTRAMPPTQAPWAKNTSSTPTRNVGAMPSTRAPWAKPPSEPSAPQGPAPGRMPPTKAPWAQHRGS